MSGRFVRASLYRHVHGDAPKPEKTYNDLRPVCNGEGNFICANDKYFAFAGTGGGGPVHIIPYTQTGRLKSDAPKLQVHKAAVLDFDFNPFMSNLIATGGEDLAIKVTAFPDGGLTENITEAAATLEGHQKKVTLVKFHPTASNVLGSVSADNTLKIWDAEAQNLALSYDAHTSSIHSFEWNASGQYIATTCQDKLVRIIDPRDPASVLSAAGMDGTKPSKVFWVDNERIGLVGFARNSTRQYSLYDIKKFDKPFVLNDIDQSAGVMAPHYDSDNGILYISGKGDASIKYFEIDTKEPYVHFLDEFRDNQSQKGVCFVPKRAVDVSKCEIARAMRLMKDSVVSISFVVPRKSELFQADLFPDTYAGVPSIESKEYFAGKNGTITKGSMKPGATTSSSTPKAEFKAKRSPAELEAELERAHARIHELEAQLAKLKH